MIASLGEWREVKRLSNRPAAKSTARVRPAAYRSRWHDGRSAVAAVMAEEFAIETEFMSIGTNGPRAVHAGRDRSSPELAYLASFSIPRFCGWCVW